MREAQPVFIVEEVPGVELHEVYQCVDVTVLRLKRRMSSSNKRIDGRAEPAPDPL